MYAAGGTVSTTIDVAQAGQTIRFDSLPDRTYGDPSFMVTASGGDSGNPVTFSASGGCSSTGTNGSTISITGAGSCTVTASQAGNLDYSAAGDVSQRFNVAQASAGITLDSASLGQMYDGNPKTVTATTDPANLSYSLTYNGSTTKPVGAGSYAVTATITDPNYQGSTTGTLVISPYTAVLAVEPARRHHVRRGLGSRPA